MKLMMLIYVCKRRLSVCIGLASGDFPGVLGSQNVKRGLRALGQRISVLLERYYHYKDGHHW